ncbi:Hypothetical predicted protein [Marmota monax]|uniref:Uncharacterized protein n=1 Tax=Marmota monax TaxID=9995 RepID=A0A5E4CF50_MARMO|nr:Hypothetical predicted protein [Marmota monax]
MSVPNMPELSEGVQSSRNGESSCRKHPCREAAVAIGGGTDSSAGINEVCLRNSADFSPVVAVVVSNW